jgi:hypothetical protein
MVYKDGDFLNCTQDITNHQCFRTICKRVCVQNIILARISSSRILIDFCLVKHEISCYLLNTHCVFCIRPNLRMITQVTMENKIIPKLTSLKNEAIQISCRLKCIPDKMLQMKITNSFNAKTNWKIYYIFERKHRIARC